MADAGGGRDGFYRRREHGECDHKISVQRIRRTEYAHTVSGRRRNMPASSPHTLGMETVLIHPLSGCFSLWHSSRSSRAAASVESPLEAASMQVQAPPTSFQRWSLLKLLLRVDARDIMMSIHSHLRHEGTDTALPPGWAIQEMRIEFECQHTALRLHLAKRVFIRLSAGRLAACQRRGGAARRRWAVSAR